MRGAVGEDEGASGDGRPEDGIRADPDRYREQYQRTLASDLAYPIHLVTLLGRWTVLDGVNRLNKADVLGWADTPAKKLSAEDFLGVLDPPDAPK